MNLNIKYRRLISIYKNRC